MIVEGGQQGFLRRMLGAQEKGTLRDTIFDHIHQSICVLSSEQPLYLDNFIFIL